MKKNFKIIVAGLFYFLLLAILIPKQPAYTEMTDTAQPTPFLVKSSSSADSALDANTMNWYDCNDWVDIPQGATTLKLKFYIQDTNDTGAPADETASFELWSADYGSGAEQVFSDGALTFGTQKLSHDPVTLSALNSNDPCNDYTWADTITGGTDEWDTACSLQNESADNDIASVLWHRQSSKKMWVRFHTFSNESTQTIYCVAYWY